MSLRILIFFTLILAIEVYFLQAVRTVSADMSPGRRSVVMWIAYVLGGATVLMGLVSLFYPPPQWNGVMRYIASALMIVVLCKLLGCLFLIVDDLFRLFRWIFSLFSRNGTEAATATAGISRLKFLSQLAIAFTIIPAAGFIYGIVRGAYRYRVHHVKVPSKNLPPEFDGYRIVQLSDIHTGSFLDNTALHKAFDIVMQQKADLILFTGDLVNNRADETEGFIEVYKKLSAPHGVFSVLGNHDYGDYVEWESPAHKRENLETLKRLQAESGWRLLMNEHVPLERNGAKIALLGIENWGGSLRFPRYGKMSEAHRGTDEYAFKILMSHDPSHWDKQVSLEYPDVDLTLSGHTHGMQMGIEIPGLKWSPVQYIYQHWAGLYKKGSQFLYVNRGLGFLGYPGRIGIWPEITVIELKKA